MKRIVLILVLAICAIPAFVATAQNRAASQTDRQRWLNEMRTMKHEFLIQELALTPQQQAAFFPVYDEMEDQLNRIGNDIRELERKINDNPRASDAEIESAARRLFEQKQAEGQIELRYFDKFKSILKPRQLFKLKEAERKFTRRLVKQHSRLSGQGSGFPSP